MFGQRDVNETNQTSGTPLSAPILPTNSNDDASINAAVDQLVAEPATGAPAVADAPFSESIMPMAPTPDPVISTSPVNTYTPPTPNVNEGSADDLVQMKQEALKHLQPLVGSLQQSPEEEFRTVMMMIQATDDKSMLKKALESAKKITDDKVRAQAMLDVINEINYFTQSHQE